MRGKLINKIISTWAVLDAETTSYDPYYKEPETSRSEKTLIELPCQVEEPSWFRAKFSYTGIEQSGEVSIILHFPDLEKNNLIDDKGFSKINIGARLVKLSTVDGNLIQEFDNPPGMYVTVAKDSSFGLAYGKSATRNLLILLLSPRERSI
jgi:hypothetical protein